METDMGYSNRTEVEMELASIMTSGNPNGASPIAPLISIGNSLTDVVSTDEIDSFIRTADEEIDAMISSIYQIPLSRVVRGSYPIMLAVTLGDDEIVISNTSRFDIGETILIRSASDTEERTVLSIVNSTTLELDVALSNGYLLGTAQVDRVRFPDPIPKISARLAAANIYDKHFAAQVEPNQSAYGNEIRGMAYEQLNGILAGAIRLEIPEAGMYVGRRYKNMALMNVPSSAAEPGKQWFKGGTK